MMIATDASNLNHFLPLSGTVQVNMPNTSMIGRNELNMKQASDSGEESEEAPSDDDESGSDSDDDEIESSDEVGSFAFGARGSTLHNLEVLYDLSTEDHDDLKQATRRAVWSNRTMENVPLGSRVLNFGDLLGIQEVVRFIVDKLAEKEVPISIFYGTLLLEYRNGTGPYFFPEPHDKDIDLVVFERHFDLVLQMDDDLRRLFGWGVSTVVDDRLYLKIKPLHHRIIGRRLDQKQVDIYGFRCIEDENLIHLPWDNVTVRLDSFLPFTEYDRPIPGIFSGSHSSFSLPLDPACLLPNMYGGDFMTPKKGHFIQQKAYDNPVCQTRQLSKSQQKALEQQLRFCSPQESINDDVSASSLIDS